MAADIITPMEAGQILRVGILRRIGREVSGLSLRSIRLPTDEKGVPRLEILSGGTTIVVQPLHLSGFTEQQARQELTYFTCLRINHIRRGHSDPYHEKRAELKSNQFALAFGSGPTVCPETELDRIWCRILGRPTSGELAAARAAVSNPTLSKKYEGKSDTPSVQNLPKNIAEFDYTGLEMRVARSFQLNYPNLHDVVQRTAFDVVSRKHGTPGRKPRSLPEGD